jgi:glycosyltransferase involved in cell wall biosynthesis
MPLRVLFSFHHSEPSGASVWLQKFLLQRPLPPKDVHLLFPSPSSMEPPLREAGFRSTIVPVEQVSISQSAPREALRLLVQRLLAIPRTVALLRRVRPDVVFVNSSVHIAPMIAARLAGCRLVVHVREGWVSGPTFPIKKWAVRLLAHGALFDARLGMELFGGQPRGRRWLFSPNGVLPHRRSEERRAATRAALGVQPDQTMALFLGTFVQRKGVQDLASAWPRILADFPNARLFSAGLVEKSESDIAIARLVAGAVPGSTFLGFRSDAYDLLEAADLFVLPSYGEAFPISIVEAMMVGTPVVARAVGDVPWQLANGRGYLFEGDGDAPLEKAIRGALADPLRHERAVKARRFAHRRLTAAIQQRQILGLLESLQP